jgi:hypothetical protein
MGEMLMREFVSTSTDEAHQELKHSDEAGGAPKKVLIT